jgi:O-antigen ligase
MLKALLFFQLMFVVNQLHFPWSTGIPAVAPTNLIFLVILLLMRGKPEPLQTDPPLLKKPLFWFYGALVLAFLWAQAHEFDNFVDDLTYLKTAIFFPLYYFLYLKCKQDEKTTRQLIIWIMVIAAVAGVEAIHEGFDYGFGKYSPFKRASGPFGPDWQHANRAGVFYGMFMPMFVALALFLKGQKLWRLGAVGGILILAAGSLFTYSRQSYIMILMAFALLLLRKSVILSVIIAVALTGVVGYLPDAVTQRVEETKQTDAKGQEEVDVSTASRWEIWEGAMGMLRDFPMGVGLNRFRNHIGNYCKHKKMDAHNFYVLTLAETGPQGLVTYLLFLLALFRLAKYLRMHSPRDDHEMVALSLGFTVTTVCVLMGQIYGSPTFEGSVLGMYWALCGLLERYVQFKMKKVAAVVTEAEATMHERFPLSVHLPG